MQLDEFKKVNNGSVEWLVSYKVQYCVVCFEWC